MSWHRCAMPALRERTATVRECRRTNLPRSARYDVFKCGRSPAGGDQLSQLVSSTSMRVASSLVKGIALIFLLLMPVLMAVGGVLSKKMCHVSLPADALDYTDLFRGSEGGKTLARACGNCHSNQTNLPWYGHVVPISWWINRHVREGKQALNFSDWTTYSARHRLDELESVCGVVSNGRMPPAIELCILNRDCKPSIRE